MDQAGDSPFARKMAEALAEYLAAETDAEKRQAQRLMAQIIREAKNAGEPERDFKAAQAGDDT